MAISDSTIKRYTQCMELLALKFGLIGEDRPNPSSVLRPPPCRMLSYTDWAIMHRALPAVARARPAKLNPDSPHYIDFNLLIQWYAKQPHTNRLRVRKALAWYATQWGLDWPVLPEGTELNLIAQGLDPTLPAEVRGMRPQWLRALYTLYVQLGCSPRELAALRWEAVTGDTVKLRNGNCIQTYGAVLQFFIRCNKIPKPHPSCYVVQHPPGTNTRLPLLLMEKALAAGKQYVDS